MIRAKKPAEESGPTMSIDPQAVPYLPGLSYVPEQFQDMNGLPRWALVWVQH